MTESTATTESNTMTSITEVDSIHLECKRMDDNLKTLEDMANQLKKSLIKAPSAEAPYSEPTAICKKIAQCRELLGDLVGYLNK